MQCKAKKKTWSYHILLISGMWFIHLAIFVYPCCLSRCYTHLVRVDGKTTGQKVRGKSKDIIIRKKLGAHLNNSLNSPSDTVCVLAIMSLCLVADMIQNHHARNKINCFSRRQQVKVCSTVPSPVTIAGNKRIKEHLRKTMHYTKEI